MAAGLSFLYTTRDGHEWYIDATLNFPFRQIDLSECMYRAFDGHSFEPCYPSLSVCQFALEEGCPEWRGEGWYWLGYDGEPEHAEWVGDIEDLKRKVSVLRESGRYYLANYGGDGSYAVRIF